MKEIIVIVILMLINACGVTEERLVFWDKNGVTEERRNKDISSCKAEVSSLLEPEEAGSIQSSAATYKQVTHVGEFDEHMEDTQKNRKRIFELCMEYLKYSKREQVSDR
jgi:hypothetical protein